MSSRILLQSPVDKNRKKESSLSCCHSFWRDPKLADHLNIMGIITSVSDTAIDLIATRCNSFAEFLTNTVPFYVSALFYLVPSIVPYVPSLLNYCLKKSESKPTVIDEEFAELERLLEEDEEIGAAFSHYEKLKEKILEKIAIFEKKKSHDSITLIINCIYLSLRAIQGIVILMRGTEATSEDISDKAKNWLDLISGLNSIIYMCAMLINYYHAQKTPSEKEIKLAREKSRPNLFAHQVNISPDQQTVSGPLIENTYTF